MPKGKRGDKHVVYVEGTNNEEYYSWKQNFWNKEFEKIFMRKEIDLLKERKELNEEDVGKEKKRIESNWKYALKLAKSWCLGEEDVASNDKKGGDQKGSKGNKKQVCIIYLYS